ncbi:AAA family ATPase [Taibaiella koreensis]|uniref:AAA family ATPase n=1 Tax=Taibaiella koreensis TaxID=1268548 RepID=UPI000E599B15|nr:AAA family ATPase [Taibaiella koreensis]
MPLINFFKPEIAEDTNKPFAIDNQSFPYNFIADPRRFEELLYSIFKLKIEKQELSDYDDVSLMGGVAEQGRDCVLFRTGKAHGVIQCKKYASNLGKDEFGCEITKFVLYSLLDERLISDPKDFTYYIAVSKDFTADCRSFIDGFTNHILIEPNLDAWLSSNLQMPTLRTLAIGNYKEEVLDILSKIKVKKIVPQDLDIELKNKPDLQSLFFSVRSVTDNTVTEKILDILNGSLSAEEISRQLHNGSISLLSERNSFEDIHDSHIVRTETTKLVNWVQIPLQKDENGRIQNVCLLAAPAGYGKTVILKDFFMECQTLRIPVLGLKADKLYSYTITELQHSIGLTLPVFDFIERCIALYSLTIIVIDQIDALSQSMSSDRRFLDVFKGLIDRFENDLNIKIIISVRNQDLNYDPTLRQLRRKNTIQVGLLHTEDVLGQLGKLGITKDRVSSKLLELLRIPNNLNIFSRIYSGGNSLRITSIEELYSELWNQKVLRISNRVNTDKFKVRNALYAIAGKMFQTQRITVFVNQFEDFSDEIKYLESEQLIKREDKHLQFFHQSFYDFVFAKQFVETGQDLLSYIKNSEQSIHIRSAVKMIISYLRDYDPPAYQNYAKHIFDRHEVLFHIKHIIFLNIITQPNPDRDEETLVKLCLKKGMIYTVLFLENAFGGQWLRFAISNRLLELIKGERSEFQTLVSELGEEPRQIICNLKTQYLQRHITVNEKEAWAYFKKIDDATIIQKILYFVADWSHSDPYEMLAKCPDFIISEPWNFYRVLEHISAHNMDFVLNALSDILPLHYQKGDRQEAYSERELLKSIAKAAPEKLFPILYQSMLNDLCRNTDICDGVIRDWTYSYTDLRDDEHYGGTEFFYQLLASCLKATARYHTEVFLKFFHENKSSHHYSVLRLILFSLAGNEKWYAGEIFEIFDLFKYLGLLKDGDDLEYDLRSIVEAGFIYMSIAQQDSILNEIRNYQDKTELRIWIDDKGKKSIYSRWGAAKYFWLLRIPAHRIHADPELCKVLMELRRKFPGQKDKPMRRGGLAGVIHSPIPANAHEFMRKKHWLRSFNKYNSERDRWVSGLKGGITELSSAFRAEVEKNPSGEKLEIINAIIDSDEIPIEYAISGLFGWTQSSAELGIISAACIRVLRKGGYNHDTYTIPLIGRVASLEEVAPELINFLIEQSLQFEKGIEYSIESDDEKTSIDRLVTKAINTPYGSAAYYLTSVGDVSFKDFIFRTINVILRNGPVESRAAIYFHFHYLTRLDRETAHDLFIESLNVETDIHVIASSIQAMQYFRTRGLKVLDAPLRLLIESGLMGNDDSDYLFTILLGSYLHNQEGAKELLETLIDKGQGTRSRMIDDIMEHYYAVTNTKSKNDQLLDYIMSGAERGDFDDISWNFYETGHVALNDVYGFAKRFINSDFFKLTENFIDYLHGQCARFPFLAIELFEHAMVYLKSKIDPLQNFQFEEKTIKFILSALEAVTGSDDVSKAIRGKLLLSFDKLIADLGMRRNQAEILGELT